MKKNIAILGLCLVVATSVFAKEEVKCKISSSPAPSIEKIRGTDAVSQSISHIYYDKNKKLQVKSYSDAYQSFRKQALDYVKADCKKYNMTEIYNFKVNSFGDKDYYHFNSTWDYN